MKTYWAVTCKDGFSMSVQASEGHYCCPRDDEGPYSQVEVAYPSCIEESLVDYMDGGPSWEYVDDDGKERELSSEEYRQQKIEMIPNGVFGFVPSGVVRAIIKKHGGIVKGQLPPLV